VDEARLAGLIEGLVGRKLATSLVEQFVTIRQDYATKTLERAAPGKFVEVFVQCLQQMATGKHDVKPSVDDYLAKRVENETALSEDLRICAARIARSIYTLRNKRNIAHMNAVDPNTVDLAFVHQGAVWIMAELIRSATGITMEEAGAAIALLQTPVGSLVEEIDGRRLVHAGGTVREQLLILLHSVYPNKMLMEEILHSLHARSEGSLKNELARMRTDNIVVGDNKEGYRLTRAGYDAATAIARKLAA
jgi:hypothetical protein